MLTHAEGSVFISFQASCCEIVSIIAKSAVLSDVVTSYFPHLQTYSKPSSHCSATQIIFPLQASFKNFLPGRKPMKLLVLKMLVLPKEFVSALSGTSVFLVPFLTASSLTVQNSVCSPLRLKKLLNYLLNNYKCSWISTCFIFNIMGTAWS